MNMTVSFIINTATYVLAIVAVLYRTFKDKIMTPFWRRLCAALAAFAAVAVLGSIGFSCFGPGSYVQPFITFITSMCGFFIPYSVLDYNLGQCLFISGIVKCYADDVALSATALYYVVSDVDTVSYLDFPAWPILTVTLVTFPFIMLFFTRLMRPALDCSGFLSSWSYIWLVPFFANLMYALYMQPVFGEISGFPGKEFIFVPFLWVILTFSNYFVLLFALVGQSRAARVQEELHLSDTQVAAQQKQLEHLQDHIEDTARVRHDMRHHLLALQGFVQNRDYEKMSGYLEECLLAMDNKETVIYTGNPALDAVLGHYIYLAEKAGVKVDISPDVSSPLAVSDTDICIIMGNLLENAYEACQRQSGGEKYIGASLYQTGTVLVIVVENSYSGDVRRKDGVFLSSKEKMRKGIGITSVMDVTKKYNGISKFEYDGSIFKVSLLLNGCNK